MADRFTVRDAGPGATDHWWALAERCRGGGVAGRVRATHERTLALAFDAPDRPADARVVVLGRADVRPGPLVTRLSAARTVSFDELGVDAGASCRLTVDRPGRDPVLGLAVGDVRVELDTGRLSLLPAGTDRPRYRTGGFARGSGRRRAGLALLDWLRATDRDDGVGWIPALATHCRGERDDRVDGLADEAVAAVRGRGPSPHDSVAHALLGRGPGSTPAGDDLLAGLVFALACGGPAVRRGALAYGRRLADWAGDRTTFLGAAMLAAAARGRAARPVRSCLADLVAADVTWPTAAVEDALALGHTSGPATLAGLLTATLVVVPRLAAGD